MRLKKNWKKISLKSFSMWAAYLGLLSYAIPELMFLTLGYQVVSPYLLGWAGVGLLFFGNIWGRIIDQGIEKDD